MTAKWSSTKFCEAGDHSTVHLCTIQVWKWLQVTLRKASRISWGKFWAAALFQTFLQFEQSTCFPSCGLLAKDALGNAFWEGGELMGWVTPGKPQSNARSRLSWWVWVCMGACPYTTKGHCPKGASSPQLGWQSQQVGLKHHQTNT